MSKSEGTTGGRSEESRDALSQVDGMHRQGNCWKWRYRGRSGTREGSGLAASGRLWLMNYGCSAYIKCECAVARREALSMQSPYRKERKIEKQ